MNIPERLVLTHDSVLLDRLRRKLSNYFRRLRDGFQAPEVDPDLTYKHRILSILLRQGCVDVEELRAHQETMSWYDEDAFNNAVGVIDAYNRDDCSHLVGGDGLK